MVLLGWLGLVFIFRVGVRVRVSINIKLFVLHFIDLYSLDGTTVISTDPQTALHDRPMLALTTDPSIAQRDRSITQIHRWRTTYEPYCTDPNTHVNR